MGKELNREDIRRKADIVGAIWSGHPLTESLFVGALLAHKEARNAMGSILHNDTFVSLDKSNTDHDCKDY